MSLAKPNLTRRIVVASFAVLMTAQVVRSAIIALASGPATGLPAAIWPTHPRVLADEAMSELETVTLQGKPLSAAALVNIKMLAREDPLASEPFLALGTNAYLNGDHRQARKLLIEARRRDARIPAVRYFLARVDIDKGRLGPALNEAAALARLVPGTSAYLAPALSQFMREAGGLDEVRQVLKVHANLAPGLLNELARDPANVDRLIALAPGIPTGPRSSRWQQTLVQGLLERKEYQKARFVWATLNGQAGRGELIHDSGFRDGSSPPPFNWDLAEDGAMVDRADGELLVTYYGRKNVVVARQILLLPVGTYELAMSLKGEIADAQTLRWVTACLPNNRALAELPIKAAPSHTLRLPFLIPSGCEAQELRLEARPGDVARSSSFTISNLQLTRQSGT